MSSEKVGWRFPPTGGGQADGFNHSGIAHFSGSPLSSLAREVIQNSLDARDNHEEPVHIDFELIALAPNDIGQEELAQAINACIDACEEVPEGERRVKSALTSAQAVVADDRVRCLRVSDRNTIGLRDRYWRSLVKVQGESYKPDIEGAGGSHGIGKYAPFAVSSLRTVFYWTCYQENGKKVEKFQGKSVLMSHQDEEGETQGTGFFGIKQDCLELVDQGIPQAFRVLANGGRPAHGTSLGIAGFKETRDWRPRIAMSVVENFFYAIDNGNLTVNIEPDEDDDLFEIDRSTLGSWFDKLLDEGVDAEDIGDEDGSGLKQARAFWEVSKGEPTTATEDQDLGHCQLWIHVDEGLPSKVAFVRREMLVTAKQRGLERFPGYRDFAALCVFEAPKGNELLRLMENPQHDQFEPDRLPDDDKERGRRALKRITDWIRGEIRKYAGPPEGGRSMRLSELSVYLPHLQPDEPFEEVSEDGDGTKEPGFGQQVTLSLKPIRRQMPPVLPKDNGSTEDGDGDGENTGSSGGGATGKNGGEGGTGGPGEGEGQGGTGSRGGSSRTKSVPISGVRILPIEGRENCYRLSFRAGANGDAKLKLEEAGDSSAIPRGDVRVVANNAPLDEASIPLTRGERTELEITADSPIGDRAWRLSAGESERDS